LKNPELSRDQNAKLEMILSNNKDRLQELIENMQSSEHKKEEEVTEEDQQEYIIYDLRELEQIKIQPLNFIFVKF
jgi:hypothetical protein